MQTITTSASSITALTARSGLHYQCHLPLVWWSKTPNSQTSCAGKQINCLYASSKFMQRRSTPKHSCPLLRIACMPAVLENKSCQLLLYWSWRTQTHTPGQPERHHMTTYNISIHAVHALFGTGTPPMHANMTVMVLRSATVDNTRSYAWEVQYAAMQFLNVYGATFSGNTLTFNSGCARLQVCSFLTRSASIRTADRAF